MELTLNRENFGSLVLEAEKPVLVDFWATWCGPCQMQAPVLEALAEKRGDILVGKVNVDDERELAMQFGISSIPTMILFRDGKAVDTIVGFSPLNELENRINGSI